MKRSLGVFSVFAICTGAAFSSFFLLPGIAVEITGPSLPLAYLAAGILMLPAIFSMSELSAAMPRSGGPYFFITRSFGPLMGIIGAFGKFIQLLLKGAFAFFGVGFYLSLVVKVPIETVAVILIVLFTFINLSGVRQTAKAEKVLVVILLIVLTYFLAAGVAEIYSETPDFGQQFLPLFPFGWQGFLSAMALVFLSFSGVGQVASVGEEIKNPAHSFPKGIFISVGVSVLIYLAGTALMIAILPSGVFRGNEAPVATLAEQISVLPLPVNLIIFAALCAFASTGNAAILSASRYPLALARDRLLWHKFGALNKQGVPKNAVLLSGAFCIGFILLFNIKEIAKIASAFLLLLFIGSCLAVIIFRESKREDYQPKFKSPLYPWIQIIGCLIYAVLIAASGSAALMFIAGVILVGLLWYSFGIRKKPQISAAIYYLMGRIARQGTKAPYAEGVNLSVDGGELAAAVEHAIFIDLDKEESFDDVVQEAADALINRLGGGRKKIAKILKEEVRHWKNPVKYDISVAPALLKGIEQPEMIIIRGKIKVEERVIRGLIVVVDDESSSNRLLKLISQLEIALNHHDFPKAWKNAEGTAEIKKALIQNVTSFSVKVENSGETGKLIGTKIRDVDLPKHSLIGAIYREGSLTVPDKDSEIQEGDELVILAQGEAFKMLSRRFFEK